MYTTTLQVALGNGEQKTAGANAGFSVCDDAAARRRAVHQRMRDVRFNVIDISTGLPVGGCEGLPYDYAKYVASVRNGVGAGFLAKRIN